ncbi:hypothetical protein WMY93_001081 [Mugilogobius chulae]|uniref:RRM domain-containing protein n=1 Tax=Mugilogobius chulae TaxID=88201 RepID=A0AAW0Q277_9GOBI
MVGAEDATKTDCPEISDVSEEEKASTPEVVELEESKEVIEEDEMEKLKPEMETATAVSEESKCATPEAEQKTPNNGENNKTKKKAKRKQKATADSSPSKKTKLINDGYCVYFGNLNNSKFYQEIKNTLANYLMSQSLLVQDIRLDKAKKHAFVDLASEMDLNKALTLNGETLLDKPMKVSKAKVKEVDEVKVKNPKVKQAKNERTLFVQNIPLSATREDVLKVFPKATAVRFLGGTESPSKGIAFVEFQHKDQANAALKMNRKAQIQKHFLRVNVVQGAGKTEKISANKAKSEAPPSDTLFVYNLPNNVEEKHIRKIFKKAVQINIPQSDGKARGFAFVEFASVAHAETALKSAKDRQIFNRNLNVQFGLKSKKDEAQDSSKTLVILGLNETTTVNTLKEAFEGALSSRIFVNKDNGTSRKFGFVDFGSIESCRLAKESAEDIEIDGCKVTVAFARPKHTEDGDSREKVHMKEGRAHKKGKRPKVGKIFIKRRKEAAN